MKRPIACSAAVIAVLMGLMMVLQPALAVSPDQDAPEKVPDAWLARLPRLDRALVDELIGKLVPEMTDDLEWAGAGTKKAWSDFRGKVLVIQTWTTGTAKGRRAPERMSDLKKELLGMDGLEVLLVHTPQGAAKVERFLEREPVRHQLVIDPSGAFCDELGAHRRPVSFVLDRYGIVRGAGLTDLGVREFVKKIAAEPYDPSRVIKRDDDTRPAPEDIEWPPFSQPVRAATDFRGRKAPEFFVDQWLTQGVDVSQRVVVYDFWATWCGPCRRAIPHMNELQNALRDDVYVVGISDETIGDFNKGMRDRSLNPRDFQYSLAIDPGSRMYRDLSIRGIPHCLVVSRDGIVRYQGSPNGLTVALLKQIVDADRLASGSAATTNPKRYRWTKK